MKPILIIDPGHGGKDPGGGSSIFYDPLGFYEKDLVLEISLYQFRRFQQLSIPVALTRNQDQYLSPEERTRIVRESGAKYCISNHINAASLESAKGAETIYSIFSNGHLAKNILRSLEASGSNVRRAFSREGANGRDYYFMHRETGAVETIIIEYGFATNRQEALQLKSEWKIPSEAVVKSICQHLGYVYSPPNDDEGSVTMVEELKKQVDRLEKEIEGMKSHINLIQQQSKMSIPDWANEAVESALEKGIIDTPEGGSYDFYRLLTILRRAKVI